MEWAEESTNWLTLFVHKWIVSARGNIRNGRRTSLILLHLETPVAPFESLEIDLIGPVFLNPERGRLF